MRSPRFSVSVVGLLLAIGTPCVAQWIPDGVRVNQSGPIGDVPGIVRDGSGGAFIGWRGYNGVSTGDDVYAQRLIGSGSVSAGWPSPGLPAAILPGSQQFSGLCHDGQGGVLIVWMDNTLDPVTDRDPAICRLRGDGTLAPGWPVGGIRIRTPGYAEFPAVTSDGFGGAYVTWDNENFATGIRAAYAQHLLGDGTVAPGWPAEGKVLNGLTTVSGAPYLTADGTGGAFFTWADLRRGVVDQYGSRILGDGSLAPGWTPGGNLLAPAQYGRGMRSDRAGGLYLCTATLSQSLGFDGNFYVRRFTSAGVPAAGWTADGLLVCNAPGPRAQPHISEDGVGGFLLCWYDYRPPLDQLGSEIFAVRVLPTGALAPGWPLSGKMVSDPGDGSYDADPDITGDGLGGAYLVWESSHPAWVQHLTAIAQPAPGWPAYGMRLAGTGGQEDTDITADGQGGAIVVWVESCCGRVGVWAQRFVMDGIVAAELSLASAEASAERVTLRWQGPGAGSLDAHVYRRNEAGDWQRLGAAERESDDRLRYEDATVTADTRYVYRLGYVEGGGESFTAESWVDVPAAFRLALDGFRPNPAIGAPVVAFSLARSGPGRIELFDLAGRRVAKRDLAALPAGRHALRLDSANGLAPGAYVLRLTHEGRTLTSRGVMVR